MRIFVSYRREDSSAWAGRLRDALAVRFGEENIFQDVVAVRPGRDFTDAVDDALGHSDTALAVIGPHWLNAAAPDGHRRLTDEDDYVRSELRAALARPGLLVPVLVGGASMPAATRFPDDLRPLALLQAVTLRDETWHADVDGLMRAVGGDPPSPRSRRWLAALAVVGGLLAAGAVVVALLNRDAGGEASGTTLSPSTLGPPTSLDPTSKKPECSTPTSSDWKSLSVTGTAPVGAVETPVAHVQVLDGYYRKEGDGWRVLLDAAFTNLTNGAQSQYWWIYQLPIDGVPVDPSCFSVTGGNDPSGPGQTAEPPGRLRRHRGPEWRRHLPRQLDRRSSVGSI